MLLIKLTSRAERVNLVEAMVYLMCHILQHPKLERKLSLVINLSPMTLQRVLYTLEKFARSPRDDASCA